MSGTHDVLPDTFSVAGEEDPGSALDTAWPPPSTIADAPRSDHHDLATVAAVMTTTVHVLAPNDTLQRAAQLMAQWNVGALPICEGQRLIGMVSDRDLVVLGTAANLAADQTPVSHIMPPDVLFCTHDQDPQEVLRVMTQAHLRSLPVIDVDKQLVGIVSLADLAPRLPVAVDSTIEPLAAVALLAPLAAVAPLPAIA
jgi:CBS domain-containing protein